MPQRLSQFRDSSELVTSTINIYLTDYGTISTTDYVANANLFRKAYNDILSKRFSSNNVTCYLWCPAGDYYFGGNPDGDLNYFPLVLNQPQIGSISIRGYLSGTKPTNSALSNASTVEDRYSLLSSYYTTRFHFGGNGVVGQSSGSNANRGTGGLVDIGLFGRYNGSPGTFNKSSSIWARGVTGNIRLERCCVHGFGAITEGNSISPATNAVNGWGIGADNGNFIDAIDVQVVDCNRGFYAGDNGTIATYGDCCSIHNKDVGIIAINGGHVLFAQGGVGYISDCSSHGVQVYNAASLQFGRGGSQTITKIGQNFPFTAYSMYVIREGYVDAYNVSYSGSYAFQGGLINTSA